MYTRAVTCIGSAFCVCVVTQYTDFALEPAQIVAMPTPSQQAVPGIAHEQVHSTKVMQSGDMGSPRLADIPLVVIDMQFVFGDPSSKAFVPGYASASASVQRLLPVFEGRTIYTKFVAPDQPQGAWLAYYKEWPFLLRPSTDPIWDITKEFSMCNANVVSKHTFSKWGPELAAATAHTHELVLVGVSTDCCVLSTALAAADAGVHVCVVADACAGVSHTSHQQALSIMAQYAPMIHVSTVEDIVLDAA